jgi:hypothetical protein
VVRTMKSATAFEMPIPTTVSSWMRTSSRGARPPRHLDKRFGAQVLFLLLDLLGRLIVKGADATMLSEPIAAEGALVFQKRVKWT